MSKSVFTVIILFLLFTNNAEARKAKSKHHHFEVKNATEIKEVGPIFKFKGGDCFNFKSVKKDARVTHCFVFTNAGDKTLFIDNVSITCAGASLKWDVEPILPGMKGHIYVTIDARELKNEFYKELYILSNAKIPLNENRYTLFISGIVEPESYKIHDDRVAGW